MFLLHNTFLNGLCQLIMADNIVAAHTDSSGH